MSLPILPGACSWRPAALPCGIPCPAALRASVAVMVLPSHPWKSPHACPWARDFYSSPAQFRAISPCPSNAIGCQAQAAARPCLAVCLPDPSVLAGSWLGLASAASPELCCLELFWAAFPGLSWFLAQGSGMGPGWGSLPCLLWNRTWLLASTTEGAAGPCALRATILLSNLLRCFTVKKFVLLLT